MVMFGWLSFVGEVCNGYIVGMLNDFYIFGF